MILSSLLFAGLALTELRAQQRAKLPPPRPVAMRAVLLGETRFLISQAGFVASGATGLELADLEGLAFNRSHDPQAAARSEAARFSLGALLHPARIPELPEDAGPAARAELALAGDELGRKLRAEPKLAPLAARLSAAFPSSEPLEATARRLQAEFDGWVESWSGPLPPDEGAFVTEKYRHTLEKPGAPPESRVESIVRFVSRESAEALLDSARFERRAALSAILNRRAEAYPAGFGMWKVLAVAAAAFSGLLLYPLLWEGKVPGDLCWQLGMLGPMALVAPFMGAALARRVGRDGARFAFGGKPRSLSREEGLSAALVERRRLSSLRLLATALTASAALYAGIFLIAGGPIVEQSPNFLSLPPRLPRAALQDLIVWSGLYAALFFGGLSVGLDSLARLAAGAAALLRLGALERPQGKLLE